MSKYVNKSVHLTDRISVPTKRTITDAGQMIVPCAFARTGTLSYKASSIGITDSASDDVVQVHRFDEEVFSVDSMESFRSSPVTIGHPKDDKGNSILVTSENAKDLQVGILEGMPMRDEDLLTGTLVITNQEAIDSIEEGNVELSAGYICDIRVNDEGEYYQTNIKANHIAIVKKGRAGSSCSIADEDDLGDKGGQMDNKSKDTNVDVEETGGEPMAKSDIKDLTDTFQTDGSGEGSEGDMEQTKEPVVKSVVEDTVVEDMTEAEAAENMAIHEEEESAAYDAEAEWAAKYAGEAAAMAEAHKAIAKAARKIANKKAKPVVDEADEGGDYYLTNDVAYILVVLDEAEAKIDVLETALNDAVENLNLEVQLRSDVIVLAKDMTDLDDFAGKTVNEIKALVVADVLDIELSSKSEAYIDARFDILCEDSDNTDTPMGRLLKNQAVEDAKDVVKVPYVDPVTEARNKMIARNK